MGLGRDWFDYKCCGTPPTAFNGNECTDHIRRDTWRDANANSRTHTWRIVFNATAFCFMAAGYTRYLESLGWHERLDTWSKFKFNIAMYCRDCSVLLDYEDAFKSRIVCSITSRFPPTGSVSAIKDKHSCVCCITFISVTI